MEKHSINFNPLAGIRCFVKSELQSEIALRLFQSPSEESFFTVVRA